MNVYFVYKVLTNRIRALIRAAGYIPDESYHVIRGTCDVTDSRHGHISPATEKLSWTNNTSSSRETSPTSRTL